MKNISKISLFILICINLSPLLHNQFASGHPSHPQLKRKEVIVHKQDNGKKIRVKVGDVVQVQLKSGGGTGYSWYLDKLQGKHLVLLQENAEPSDTQRMVGEPVTITWKFEAKSKGLTSINLYFYRAWEGKEKAIDTFKIFVRID